MSKRKDILDHLKQTIQQATGLDASQVTIGHQLPTERGGLLVNIVPASDTSRWGDGDTVIRKLTVAIGVIAPIDESESAEATQQATDAWEKIEPKMEPLFKGDSEVSYVQEASTGVEWDTLDERRSTYAVVGCTYEIEYERALNTS